MSISAKEYDKIRGAFYKVSWDKQVYEDLAHDFALLKLRGKTLPYYWQFATRHEKRHRPIPRGITKAGNYESKSHEGLNLVYEVLETETKNKNGRKILDLYLKGYEYSEMAEVLGVSKQAVHAFMMQLIDKCRSKYRRDLCR